MNLKMRKRSTTRTQGDNSFLNFDQQGDALLKHIGDGHKRITVKAAKLALKLRAFETEEEYDEEYGDYVEGTACEYLTHFGLQFIVDCKFRACSCEFFCHHDNSEPDKGRLWEKSGVTIPHLLEHVKGLKRVN